MSLIDYAKAELEIAGFDDADADYGPGEIMKCVLDLVTVFAKQGHSGGSAHLVLSVFERVARFKPLSEITSNPVTWMEVTAGMWQSTRDPEVFSKDGGLTWYRCGE